MQVFRYLCVFVNREQYHLFYISYEFVCRSGNVLFRVFFFYFVGNLNIYTNFAQTLNERECIFYASDCDQVIFHWICHHFQSNNFHVANTHITASIVNNAEMAMPILRRIYQVSNKFLASGIFHCAPDKRDSKSN